MQHAGAGVASNKGAHLPSPLLAAGEKAAVAVDFTHPATTDTVTFPVQSLVVDMVNAKGLCVCTSSSKGTQSTGVDAEVFSLDILGHVACQSPAYGNDGSSM